MSKTFLHPNISIANDSELLLIAEEWVDIESDEFVPEAKIDEALDGGEECGLYRG
jgi:hypothetical protein